MQLPPERSLRWLLLAEQKLLPNRLSPAFCRNVSAEVPVLVKMILIRPWS
jgi:hypothetical protein